MGIKTDNIEGAINTYIQAISELSSIKNIAIHTEAHPQDKRRYFVVMRESIAFSIRFYTLIFDKRKGFFLACRADTFND